MLQDGRYLLLFTGETVVVNRLKIYGPAFRMFGQRWSGGTCELGNGHAEMVKTLNQDVEHIGRDRWSWSRCHRRHVSGVCQVAKPDRLRSQQEDVRNADNHAHHVQDRNGCLSTAHCDRVHLKQEHTPAHNGKQQGQRQVDRALDLVLCTERRERVDKDNAGTAFKREGLTPCPGKAKRRMAGHDLPM